MEIILNNLIMAFSTALDYVEASLVGVVSGHSERVASLSVRMAIELGIEKDKLFYLSAAAALHDNALTEFIREELKPEIEEKETYIVSNLGSHCVMGEINVSKLSIYPKIKAAILFHHEQADGKGPFKKRPDEIPVFARLIHFADIMDATFNLCQIDTKKYNKIIEFLDGKGRDLFDAQCIDTFKAIKFSELSNGLCTQMKEIIPIVKVDYDTQEIKGLADFFAKIIDYKSPFTCSHSLGIAQKAWEMSEYYRWSDEDRDKMYLSGALHDVGKLMVDNDILHKQDKLTSEEYETIQDHALGTYKILSKVSGFEDITRIASLHHEKLDGSGYPFQKTADELGTKERLLMVLDIYQALTETRPYKEGFSHEKAMSIIVDMVNKGQLDGDIANDIDLRYGEMKHFMCS